MSRRVVVSPEARRDLLRLNAFLAEKSETAAWRAMTAVDAGLRALSQYPLQGPDCGAGQRELMIPFGQAGYVARYRVDAEVVIIARIFHMREDRG